MEVGPILGPYVLLLSDLLAPTLRSTSPHSRSCGGSPRTRLPRLLEGRSEDRILEHVGGGDAADAAPMAVALLRSRIFEPKACPREMVPHARLLLLSRLALHCYI